VNGEGVLLDSVILIDHFNGVVKATRYLRRVAKQGHVSAITRAEVLSGFDPPGAGRPGCCSILFLSSCLTDRSRTWPPSCGGPSDGDCPTHSRRPLPPTTA